MFISREDLLAAKLAAGRSQDLADVEALSEHLASVPLDPATEPSVSDMEAARKQAVTDWLAYRAQQEAARSSPTLEERRAKAVEEWKKLQKQKTRGSNTDARSRVERQNEGEQARGGGKDVADDPDF